MAGQLMTIRLSRVDAQPWGFRLQGGKDFAAPLVVQKVNGGSLAEQAGLLAGDALIKVNNLDVFNMRHKDAQDLIVRSGNNFDITIQRGGSVWRPQVTPTGSIASPISHGNSAPTVTKTSLAYKPQEVRHIGSGYNNAARPFSSVNGTDGQVKSIVNKQYNTPVGIYSEEAIAETLSAQAEVLAGGVLGVNFKKNEKIYNAANSEVLKMLHEVENDNEPVEEHQAPANFFWTASHAVGGAAGVKSHRRDEEHQQPQAPSAQPKPREDERIGTPLKQNTLAPTAPHRPSLPSQAPVPATAPSYPSQRPYYPQATQPTPKPFAPTFGAPPRSDVAKQGGGIGCDDCGVSITATKLSANTISAALDTYTQHNGSSNLNTGYGGPKPFNSSPMSPPMRGPQSPSIYPPPTTAQTWDTPVKPQSKPQVNPYATLPRTTGHSQAAANQAASAAFSTDSSKLTNTTSSAIPVPAFKAPTPFTSSAGPSAGQLFTNAAQGVAPAPQPPTQPITNNVAYKPPTSAPGQVGMPAPPPPTYSNNVPNVVNDPSPASAGPTSKGGAYGATSAPKRGRGILNKAVGPGVRVPICGCCNTHIRGPFITALGRIWCPEHFVCVNGNCRRPLQDIGFVEEKGDLYCEFCFEKYLAPTCSKCNTKIKGDCLNAIGKHYHPECFTCSYCGKLFGNSPFFLEEGEPYCEADWNELFTTKCFACGFPVEAGDRWVEALNHNYHSQCFNCTMCKKNLEGQSFYNKGGRPFCKNHAR